MHAPAAVHGGDVSLIPARPSLRFGDATRGMALGAHYNDGTMGTSDTFQSDAIVDGSGPGGATVARELARAEKHVLLLERGQDHRGRGYYGTYLGAMLYSDRSSLLFTEEG